MVFAKPLRARVRSGRIRCSIRIWTHPHVKVGGRYPMDDGHIVVDSIDTIRLRDITRDLAQESGFESVKALLEIAKHGKGNNVYLIRFHYLPPGAWDMPRWMQREPASARASRTVQPGGRTGRARVGGGGTERKVPASGRKPGAKRSSRSGRR